MSEECSPTALKELFLANNNNFEESDIGHAAEAVGNINEIDLAEDEVWLMQCPKGLNIKELESQMMKMPGRTNFGNLESVCMEFTDEPKKEAFAYFDSRKSKYSLRILPVRGSIIVRERLKANKPISEEEFAQHCPTKRKVAMPRNINIRHPLLGSQYEDIGNVDTSVIRRSRKADKQSAEVLKDSLLKKSSTRSRNLTQIKNSGNESEKEVEFVSETKGKKKKKKKNKTYDEDRIAEGLEVTPKKRKKSKNCTDDDTINDIEYDFQWLHDLNF
uniref:Uncharacterized protein n=1 Tax=Glossina palpalis gambiensis TaxID=67801 RepID=A0A1B0BVV0_9MUSC